MEIAGFKAGSGLNLKAGRAPNLKAGRSLNQKNADLKTRKIGTQENF